MSADIGHGAAATGGPGARTLHVCPLSAIHDVIALTRATRLVTLIDPGTIPETPSSIETGRHLRIGVHDIDEALPGLIAPTQSHVGELLAFAAEWEAHEPLLIHCWAGISRSTAAAFITACAIAPAALEALIARRLRAASPTATPNRRLVALADDLLNRRGRMVDAISAIGPGTPATLARPFDFQLDFAE